MGILTTSDNASIYYETHGFQTAGPVMVFLNGTTQTTFNWRPLAKRLKNEFRVLLYDARTQGQSQTGGRPLSLEVHAADLAELLYHLSIARAHLVGISHGARVALAQAEYRPLSINRLVLCGLADNANPVHHITLAAWVEILNAGGRKALAWALLTTLYGDSFLIENRKVLDKMVNGIVRRNRKEALLAHLKAMTGYPSPSLQISRLNHPTLFISGGRDPLADEATTRQWARSCGGKHLHFPSLGHAIPMEAPVVFVKELSRFLED